VVRVLLHRLSTPQAERAMNRRCVICGQLSNAPRCPTHRTRQARGYGAAHTRARRTLVAALPIACAYCGALVLTADTLAAAHVIDGNPNAGWQPAHRICNERAKHR
jgi:hypothetical protein